MRGDRTLAEKNEHERAGKLEQIEAGCPEKEKKSSRHSRERKREGEVYVQSGR